MNDRRLVQKAELAALNPDDALRLLGEVVAHLRSMVQHGRVREADRVIGAMLPGTSNLVALAALGDLDRPDQSSGDLVELLVRQESKYLDTLEREHAGDGEARQRAHEIEHERSQMSARQRDRDFLERFASATRDLRPALRPGGP